MDKFMRSLRKLGQGLTDMTLDQTSYKLIELRKAGFALKQYEYCAKKNITDYPPELLPALQQQIDMFAEGSLQLFVEGEITRQLVHMFRYIQQEHNHNILQQHQPQENRVPSTKRKLQMPFMLELKPSTIRNAGDGVFVKLLQSEENNGNSTNNFLRPGTVIALYPGLVHLKEHLNDRSYLKTLLPDPDFMLQTRLDQMIIDARKLSTIPLPSPNPYALAHKINHCVDNHSNSKTESIVKHRNNVLQVTYNYPDSEITTDNFPSDLRPWIPNRYARTPSEKSAQDLDFGNSCMHGLVMVTTEPLYDNTELFMDYRLHPEAGAAGLWPSWYAPYDIKHTEQRWLDQKKFL